MSKDFVNDPAAGQTEKQGGLARLAYAFTEWAETWFPDAFVFVILTVIAVTIANLATGAAPIAIAKGFGDGFWTLIPFTMQMAMVAITGYVVAASPPCTRLINRLAAVPSTGAGAIASMKAGSDSDWRNAVSRRIRIGSGNPFGATIAWTDRSDWTPDSASGGTFG